MQVFIPATSTAKCTYREVSRSPYAFSFAMVIHVAVVGAGIIGCSVAAWLLENLSNDVTVTLLSEDFSPDTTASDKSGSLVIPPDLNSGENAEYSVRVKKWVRGTFTRLRTLYMSQDCCKMGLSYVHGYTVRKLEAPPSTNPWWKDLVMGFRVADNNELSMFNAQGSLLLAFGTFTINCRAYLPWLLFEFRKKGGIVVKRKVKSFAELSSFDIVINCSGMGASVLAHDPKLHSVKGYLIRVRAPWVKFFYHVPRVEKAGKRTYIIPRDDGVILGGIGEYDYSSDEVDPHEIQGILDRCREQVPSLCGAEVVEHWTGYRPVREGGVRLEVEQGSTSPVVIHCYGHGHFGVTLHWGCAEEVGALVQSFIAKKLPNSLL